MQPIALQLPGVTVERIVFLGLPKAGAHQARLPGGQVRGVARGHVRCASVLLAQRAGACACWGVARQPLVCSFQGMGP